MNKFEHLIGREIKYISSSGKEYIAIVTAIPENPIHGYTNLPSVSLVFKDNRGKYIKKSIVCPFQEIWMTTQVWKEYPEGKHRWEIKNGIPLFVNEA